MSSNAETTSDTDSSNVQTTPKQSIKEYVAQRKAQKENPDQTISEYIAQRKAQAEQHQKDMIRQEEQYKKDLAEYEKQKAEYERQVQQLEAEKQAEEQRIAAEKAESDKIKADRQAIIDRYDSQIDDIQKQKEPSLVFKPWTGKQPYLHNSTPVIRPDGTRTTHRGWVPRGYKIGKLMPQTQSRIRHLNGRINSLKHQQREELNRYDAQSYPSWAKRGWSSSSFPDTSLAEYAQRKIDAKNAEAEARRRSSIKNAQSNAIKARENHEKTAREFESKRDSLGTKLSEGQIRLAQLKEPQKATRTRPKIHSSSYFSEVENTPVSILGTNLAKSRQAEETFEITQTQQRQLHQKVTGASSWNEAVKLRKEAMELNPHVGTANSHFYKDDLIGSSGVLIEKKPKIQRGLEQYSVTIDGKTRTFNTKETADKFLTRYESIKYPTTLGQYYTVQTPDGNITRKFESFSDARKYQQDLNRTLDTEADIYKEYDKSYIGFSPDGQPIHGPPAPAELTPNKKDSKNLISPNEIPIQENNMPIFVDVEQQRRAEEIRIAGGTYGDYLKTLDKNTLDYQLKEIGLGAKRSYNSYTGLAGYNLVNPQTHGLSLLDSIFHDAIKYVENPNDPKSYSTTTHAIKNRSPAQHAGDLITTGAIETGVFLATGGIGNLAIRGAGKLPYILKAKPESVTQYLKHQKDADLGYLKAQELAERIFSSSKELRAAEQLEADVIFRRKSEKLAKAIRQSNKETPVGIEKISDNSYLISAGTEGKESLPMVLYRTGKNSKSTVFSPVKPDDVITPKNILVKGNSKNELSGAEKLAKDVSVAPGNAKNLEKISDNTIDNFLKPESILTDVPNSFLEKYPKVAVHGAAV